jgi:hypothetical protein
MKIAYQFSGYEICNHSIQDFESLFSISRIKSALAENPSFARGLIGKVRLFFELNVDGLQPHEDPNIRKLCLRLLNETAAPFLASTSDGQSMSSLFFATLPSFTTVSFEQVPGKIRFDCDIKEARKHADRFQKRILAVAKELDVSPEHCVSHCAEMKLPLY